ADVGRRGAGAAVDACQRDLGRRLRHRRGADENDGADADHEQGQGSQHGVLPGGMCYGSTRPIFTLRRVRADSIIANVTSTTPSRSRPVAAGWPPVATARWKSSISATEFGSRASGESARSFT